MADLTSAIRNTISISLFNKGMAGQIFSDVKRNGAKVVMKNNTPECVLLSPEEYIELMDELNNMKLLALAENRLTNVDSNNLISHESLVEKMGFSKDDLEGFEEVEFD